MEERKNGRWGKRGSKMKVKEERKVKEGRKAKEEDGR
jgi:hypothetical protein